MVCKLTGVDKLGVWMGRITVADITLHGEPQLKQLLADKQGAVLLMAHHGNFEICRCLSARHAAMRLTVLMHTKNAQKFNQLLNQQSASDHTQLLEVNEVTPTTAMILSERVERGEFVAIAADRVAVNNPDNCLEVDFLEEKAPLPGGPFTLASILKVPVIALSCIKQDDGFHVYFETLSEQTHYSRKERQQRMQILAQAYADTLQGHVLQQPAQWFNFFDFWQRPTADTNNSQDTARS
jgi:predicted LPLAT superfamily acyltransferase